MNIIIIELSRPIDNTISGLWITTGIYGDRVLIHRFRVDALPASVLNAMAGRQRGRFEAEWAGTPKTGECP